MQYTNRKGKVITLVPTVHAVDNFIRRWNRLHPNARMNPKEALRKMDALFEGATRVKNLSRKEQRRLKRHTADTMFFRSHEFTFVVQNQAIVTVEISAGGYRHLNKPRRRIESLLEGKK